MASKHQIWRNKAHWNSTPNWKAITAAAAGNWASTILPAFDIPAAYLTGQPSRCSLCGADDAFIFVERRGGWFECGSCKKEGNGFFLVGAKLGITPGQAAYRVGTLIGMLGPWPVGKRVGRTGVKPQGDKIASRIWAALKSQSKPGETVLCAEIQTAVNAELAPDSVDLVTVENLLLNSLRCSFEVGPNGNKVTWPKDSIPEPTSAVIGSKNDSDSF